MKAFRNHGCQILPYFESAEDIHFFFEQKDPKYNAPFFNDGLSFLGGAWALGIDTDTTVADVVQREVDEEYWKRNDHQISMGEHFSSDCIADAKTYDEPTQKLISQIIPLFTDGMLHAADYTRLIRPPVVKQEIFGIATVYIKQVDSSAAAYIQELIRAHNGLLSTDNLTHGSHTACVSLSQINERNHKFAWGYDKILSDLVRNTFQRPIGVLRSLDSIAIEPISLPKTLIAKNLPFKDLMSHGFKYEDRTGLTY